MHHSEDFAGLTYEQALQKIRADPATSYSMLNRIVEDSRRDPLDALADAEMLHALMTMRLRAALKGPHRVAGAVQPRPENAQ